MDKYKKKFASALDGLRNHHTKVDIEVTEKITSNHITLTKIVRHGFPDKARCLSYDPVQKLIAIGSGNGSVRLLGDAGVDYHLRHQSGAEVIHIKFLINEGGLITTTRDDMIHLWNYRQKYPDIVHSLQMRQEKITCIELPVSSKWLYIGTERGNVYVLCVATFKLSSYTINWNKAIDLSCRTHPGPVRHLSISPSDPTKLLIGFDNGYVVLWNLLNKEAERYKNNGQIKNISWHHDGKQFMCGCNDGSLVIWNVKKSSEPYQVIYPREKKCRPITHLFWHQGTTNDMVIFAGGMSLDDGATPAITVMKPKGSLSVLELDHPIVDVFPILNSPYSNIPQLPQALVILMKEELIVLDLSVSGFPTFENPHPTDISESPVVCMKYYSDCPIDIVSALTLIGCKQRTANPRISSKTWPINGGEEREVATSNQELLLTGHEDGSIKFWQSSGDHLQLMYKLKVGRHFEKTETNVPLNQLPECFKNPHSVTYITMCLESRLLAVSGNAGQVTLFRLNKNESANDIAVINVIGSYSIDSPIGQSSPNAGECGGSKKQNNNLGSRTSSMTSEGSQCSEQHPLKVRGGAIRRAPGFQPELVCLISSSSQSLLNNKKIIGSISLNSAFGLMAIGTINDLCLVDIVQCSLIFCLSISELYNLDSISNTPSLLNVDSPQDPLSLSMSQYCSEISNNSGTSDVNSDLNICNKKEEINDRGQNLTDQGPRLVNLLRRRTSEMAHNAKKRIEKRFSQHHTSINNKPTIEKTNYPRPDMLLSPIGHDNKKDSLKQIPYLSIDLVDTPSPSENLSEMSTHSSCSMSTVSFSLPPSSQEVHEKRPKSENCNRVKLIRSRNLSSVENPDLLKQSSEEHDNLSISSSNNLRAQTSFGTASNIVRRLTGKSLFGKSKPTVISKNEKNEDITPTGSYLDLTDNSLYNNTICG
uniref:WD_REPEATS_REGION domain-containing protein n=1 Tax=Parastrongyloides trichosuri TaxID=131310 RepID=A0A0N4ZIA0_PARTI